MNHYGKNFDFGGMVDEIVNAARQFGEKMKEMGPEMGPFPFGFDPCRGPWAAGPGPGAHRGQAGVYFYPPTNSYTTRDGSLVFEFALAGIDESAVSVTFQGDYLVLTAKAATKDEESDAAGYSRRGFRPRDIDRQKYGVPAEDYAQEKAKAVFRNGVLTVTVPPKESEGGGVRIEIVKEGN